MTDRDHRAVRAYYAEVWLPRFAEGHNAGSLAMHYGVGDPTREGVDATKRATNRVVHQLLSALHGSSARVADLGCGVGGTAVHLAELEPAWELLAVNVAEDQLAFASAAAVARGASDRIRFVRADYASLPIADRSLDAAWFVESACHATDRVAVLREVSRVLAPGGVVVIVDFGRTSRPLASAAERRVYAEVCRGFCIPDYFDVPLDRVLAAAGLEATRRVDLTAAVLPGVARSAARAREIVIATPRWQHHVATLLGIEALVASGHLEYGAVVAARPRST